MSAVLPPELSPRPAGSSGPGSAGERGRGARLASLTATVLAAVVFVASTGGWVLATYYDMHLDRIPGLGGALSQDAEGPLTFLVVGSDNREGLTTSQARELSTGTAANAAGQRSDTMMLVHLSADRDDITVVSLPRDSYLTIPAYTDNAGQRHPAHKNKLNAAFALGGAELLINTVNDATGLKVDHYVEVGFAGVVKMVDALGGVDVCVPTAVNDWRSGLDLPAGTTHVDGVMGLSYVRARYIDPTADIGRMERQQRFLGSMFQQATSAGVLLNPLKLDSFLKAALSSVKLDEGMSRDMLLDLSGDLADLSPRDLRFLTVPIANANYTTDVGSSVLWNKRQAQEVFAALEADEPLVKKPKGIAVEVAPEDISVQVLNGSTVEGLATEASDDLEDAGYVIGASPTNADATDTTTTVIRYDPQWSTSVKTLEAAFPDATLEKAPGIGGTFQIMVGTEYAPPEAVRLVKPDTKLNSRTAADDICG